MEQEDARMPKLRAARNNVRWMVDHRRNIVRYFWLQFFCFSRSWGSRLCNCSGFLLLLLLSRLNLRAPSDGSIRFEPCDETPVCFFSPSHELSKLCRVFVCVLHGGEVGKCLFWVTQIYQLHNACKQQTNARKMKTKALNSILAWSVANCTHSYVSYVVFFFFWCDDSIPYFTEPNSSLLSQLHNDLCLTIYRAEREKVLRVAFEQMIGDEKIRIRQNFRTEFLSLVCQNFIDSGIEWARIIFDLVGQSCQSRSRMNIVWPMSNKYCQDSAHDKQTIKNF